MRPLALEPRLLRGILRDLESASDEVATAAARVVSPTATHPWQGLVERGVALLLRDAGELAGSCHQLSAQLAESLDDFETLDGHVAGAARTRE